ncbi:MAG: pentapeptide repeat-containing protein [Robiginitomaculum sp.]|nr:pentapeptide repeat-containing protein [Robiginitomaculum sp.]
MQDETNPDGLNSKQKDINDDPAYWDHFDRWWDQDFSWDGLANKNIYNSGQTLQNYWWDEREDLIEFAKKKWTRFHLPFHDKDGNLSPRHEFTEDQIAQWQQEITKKLDEASTKQVAQFTGVIFPENFMSTRPRTADPDMDIHLRADWARFGDNASCSDLIFSGNANFSNAQFGPGASFNNAQFNGSANFTKTQFDDDTSFEKAKFEGVADFGGARFRIAANFVDAEFKDRAIFTKAQFVPIRNFHQSKVFRRLLFCWPAVRRTTKDDKDCRRFRFF